MELSLVIPVKDEEENLSPLLAEIQESLSEWVDEDKFEVLLIDDGSRDKTWFVIQQLKEKYPFVRAWRFQYNCGKATALQLGFKEAKGRLVGTLDGDLQDNPNEFKEMARLIREEGYDLISGWKKKRYDPIHKTLPSKFFNLVTSRVAGVRLHDFNCGLKLYRSEVVRHLKLYGDFHRFIPVLAAWMGFRITEKVVVHRPRIHGVSKYGWSRLISGFLDLLSLVFIQFFSRKPLHFFGVVGLLIFSLGLGILGYFLGVWLIDGALHVRPLMVVGMTAMITGAQFLIMGLLGEMILNRTLNEAPPVSETL